MGSIGDCFCWHPYILHGTYPALEQGNRISLRILAEKNSDINKGCILDQTNSFIKKAEPIIKTRSDLDKKGQSKGDHNLLELMRDIYI